MLKIALTALLVLLTKNNAYASEDAEEARWLVQTATWGTLSWLESEVSSMVTSFGEHEGTMFIYIPYGDDFPASMTISEAQLNPLQFEGAKCGPNGDLDPEDPRCGKLTLSGVFEKVVDDETKKIGQDALFTSHPAMKDWPDDHGFTMLKLNLSDLWMIANFGGGGAILSEEYYAATPAHHPVVGFGNRKMTQNLVSRKLVRPNFKGSEDHARWLVSQSLWTTVSTDASDRLGNGLAWGNIRSVTDGECIFASSGLPVFYLPAPDPTTVDVVANSNIALSFTEAALHDLVGEDGKVCGGSDPEDPTCAKLSLHGTARKLEDNDMEYALKSFGTTHPRASWLSSGGAHTGGDYYTIDVTDMEFFMNYGGMAEITVEDYINWKPEPSSEFDKCEPRPNSSQKAGYEHTHASGSTEHTEASGSTEHTETSGSGKQMHHGEGGMQSSNEGSTQSANSVAPSNASNENVGTVKLSYGFLSGTVFGFMFWGPTIAYLIHTKLRGGQSYSSLNPPTTAAQVV